MGIVSMFVVAPRASCVSISDVLLYWMAAVDGGGVPGDSLASVQFSVLYHRQAQEEDGCGQ